MSSTALPRRIGRKLVAQLGVWILQAQARIGDETLPRFANHPEHLIIDLPRRIIHPEHIFIGDHVWLGPGCFINAVTRYPTPSLTHPEKTSEVQTFMPEIRIGHRVTSSGQLVVGAAKQVAIGEDVLLSFNVTILDNLHGYENVRDPYKYQPLQRIAPVVIKRGSWIGQNSVILPGVTIGEMAIIGANSVVTKSVPDRCIAVGAPARIIKRWDENICEWRSYEAARTSGYIDSASDHDFEISA